MHRTKRIAIIVSDTLQSIGLQTVLIEYFPPVEVCYFPSFPDFSKSNNDSFDYFFIQSDTFVINTDFFLPRKNKTIVLICNDNSGSSTTNNLSICAPQEIIIEQIQVLFASETNTIPGEGNKELSSREIDVLQLIVKGYTNKDIADKLNISLNTVLTHRKNITAKLEIKTVSGLTIYAIMNGLISADDIEL